MAINTNIQSNIRGSEGRRATSDISASVDAVAAVKIAYCHGYSCVHDTAEPEQGERARAVRDLRAEIRQCQ
jgi:hypothetical protein